MICRGDQLGLEFSPEEIKSCREKNGLLSLELELTHSCDLRCIYCYASSGEPLDNELSLNEIRTVITRAIELGAQKIIVLGGGEPLRYPHLFEVLEYIRERDLEVDLFTNGQTLNKEVAQKLYDLQTGIVLKMNSRKKDVQDRLAGRAGATEAIAKALQALQDCGYPDEHHSLGIETIICQPNYSELPELWRWARQQGIAPYFETMTMQGRASEHKDLEVNSDDIKMLFEELSRIDREEFGCDWQPHPPLVASQCARHEYSCTITSTGEVQPCPGVDVSGGSIRDSDLAEILEKSKVFRELRSIRANIKGHCATCEISPSCYGCRGHAYQVTGDYLAEDPLCWLKHPENKN
jgi:radical SAM protein with 4Fe4S-binding SPASM domain